MRVVATPHTQASLAFLACLFVSVCWETNHASVRATEAAAFVGFHHHSAAPNLAVPKFATTSAASSRRRLPRSPFGTLFPTTEEEEDGQASLTTTTTTLMAYRQAYQSHLDVISHQVFDGALGTKNVAASSTPTSTINATTLLSEFKNVSLTLMDADLKNVTSQQLLEQREVEDLERQVDALEKIFALEAKDVSLKLGKLVRGPFVRLGKWRDRRKTEKEETNYVTVVTRKVAAKGEGENDTHNTDLIQALEEARHLARRAQASYEGLEHEVQQKAYEHWHQMKEIKEKEKELKAKLKDYGSIVAQSEIDADRAMEELTAQYRAKEEGLNTEMNVMKRQLETERRNLATAEKSVDAIRLELNEKEEKLKQIASEAKTGFNQTKLDVHQEKEDLEAEHKRHVEAHRSEVATLREEIEQRKDAVRKLGVQREEIVQARDELEGQVEKLKKQYEEEKRAHREDAERAREEMERKEEEHKQQLDKYVKEVEDLRVEIAELQSRPDGEGRVQELERKLKELTTRYEEECKAHERDVASAKEETEKLKSVIWKQDYYREDYFKLVSKLERFLTLEEEEV